MKAAARSTRWVIGAAVVVIVGFTLVAMSRGRSSNRPPGVTGKLIFHGTANVSDGRRLTVVLGERSFNPTVLRGPAGARIVVHLRAEGFHAHTFTVPDLNIDVTVAPGGVADVPITIPDAPSAPFYCRFHKDQGMQGAIVERTST